MKIVFVDVELDKMGGVGRAVSTLVNSLVQEYDVEIYSVYRYFQEPFYSYRPSVKFHYLIDLSHSLSTHSKTKISFFFFRVFEKLFESFFFSKKVKMCCENELEKADVIVFCRTVTAAIFLPYLEEFQGKIIVRDANHLHMISARDRKRMLRYYPALVNTFIVSSDESLRLYREFFGERSVNIRKIYNPLGIKPLRHDSMENRRIIGVGRYCRENAFENLLTAFAQIYPGHMDWKLALIGGGEDLFHYKRICRKLGILQAVEFYKSTDIAEEYRRADIYVSTSRMEGYANAVVEALACGVPVISYNWYLGVEDIIEDGVNGIVVRLKNREKHFRTNSSGRDDVLNLAKAIRRLIEDRDFRMKLSQNAVKIADSRECSKIVNEWTEIMEGTG